MSQRKFDIQPSCTRFRHNAKLLFSEGGEAIEYARVISSPPSFVCLSDSHCPGTKPNRGTCNISNSRCLVIPESGAELIRRAVKVCNAIFRLDDRWCLDDVRSPISGPKPRLQSNLLCQPVISIAQRLRIVQLVASVVPQDLLWFAGGVDVVLL